MASRRRWRWAGVPTLAWVRRTGWPPSMKREHTSFRRRCAKPPTPGSISGSRLRNNWLTIEQTAVCATCITSDFSVCKTSRPVSESLAIRKLARNASDVTEARFHRRGEREQGALARFRYSRLKEACPWLRRTRALCKFNGGKERPEDTAERCGSAQYTAACADKLDTAKKYLKERG